MRIWTDTCREKQYFLTIYFEETGSRHYVRVGRETLMFGKGRGHAGKLARVQIEVKDGEGAIEFFPGAIILGVNLSSEAGIDERYQATLNPKYDAVQLVSPRDSIILPPDLALDVAGDNQKLKTQLEVLNGKRRRFIGG